jgi:hypothetical protein
MLLALVLSSIIFVSAYQVISNLVQYQVRARAQSESQLDSLLAANLLGQVIEKGISQYDVYYGNQKSTLFEGDSDSLQILSRAYSDRFDSPGYRVYRLFQRDGELFVTYRAFDHDFLANERFEIATGIHIDSLNFEYLEAGRWLSEWNDDRVIPELIRVSVGFAQRESSTWIRGTSRR